MSDFCGLLLLSSGGRLSWCFGTILGFPLVGTLGTRAFDATSPGSWGGGRLSPAEMTHTKLILAIATQWCDLPLTPHFTRYVVTGKAIIVAEVSRQPSAVDTRSEQVVDTSRRGIHPHACLRGHVLNSQQGPEKNQGNLN